MAPRRPPNPPTPPDKREARRFLGRGASGHKTRTTTMRSSRTGTTPITTATTPSAASVAARSPAVKAAEAKVQRARHYVQQLGRVQDRAASLAGVLSLEARDTDSRAYAFAAVTVAHTVSELWQAAEQIAEATRVDALLVLLESGVVGVEGVAYEQ